MIILYIHSMQIANAIQINKKISKKNSKKKEVPTVGLDPTALR